MNERIRELATQAREYTEKYNRERDNKLIAEEWTEVYNKKFAELIVKECSRVIVNGGYRNPALGEKHPLTPPEIATMIKEHFGVEE
jgi:hypothetical protein